MELVKTMFSSQFDMARSIAGDDLPPVYTYAVETSIQLALTELNEEPAGTLHRVIYTSGYRRIHLSADDIRAEKYLRTILAGSQ